MDVDASVTNFDNLDVLVQFWSEFIKRNPNEAYKTNAWGGVFDILRTICEDPLIGKPNMREMKGLLTALGTAADPVAGATVEAREAANQFLKYLYTEDIIITNDDDNNNEDDDHDDENDDNDNDEDDQEINHNNDYRDDAADY
mmetsp:Transcript_16436/g.18957  ORF Transcript_16436/g.18957 Transcript_16436/m.18957 type:complete len:143 (+) Transcript_16436:403-831(+)